VKVQAVTGARGAVVGTAPVRAGPPRVMGQEISGAGAATDFFSGAVGGAVAAGGEGKEEWDE
jgi:hypothetical protein